MGSCNGGGKMVEAFYDDVIRMYRCVECGNEYAEEEDANNCCGGESDD